VQQPGLQGVSTRILGQQRQAVLPMTWQRRSRTADLAVVAGTGDGRGGGRGKLLVCFAGEATSRRFMGTVHGAYVSGEREARRLLQEWFGSS